MTDSLLFISIAKYYDEYELIYYDALFKKLAYCRLPLIGSFVDSIIELQTGKRGKLDTKITVLGDTLLDFYSEIEGVYKDCVRMKENGNVEIQFSTGSDTMKVVVECVKYENKFATWFSSIHSFGINIHHEENSIEEICIDDDKYTVLELARNLGFKAVETDTCIQIWVGCGFDLEKVANHFESLLELANCESGITDEDEPFLDVSGLYLLFKLIPKKIKPVSTPIEFKKVVESKDNDLSIVTTIELDDCNRKSIALVRKHIKELKQYTMKLKKRELPEFSEDKECCKFNISFHPDDEDIHNILIASRIDVNIQNKEVVKFMRAHIKKLEVVVQQIK